MSAHASFGSSPQSSAGRSTLLVNQRMAAVPADARPGTEVQAFHERLPGYAPTPLHDIPELAAANGVGRVLVKDETSRLGLPAFKILGASWATYRVLCQRLGGEPEWATLDDLAAIVPDRLGPLRLVTATDGNHGRALAYVARLLGLSAHILVPAGTATARITDIESEGAEVEVVDGHYEDAVAAAAALAGERDLVISDTSWPGYEDPPRWVIEGYSTIFAELDHQLAELDAPTGSVGATSGEAAGRSAGGLEVRPDDAHHGAVTADEPGRIGAVEPVASADGDPSTALPGSSSVDVAIVPVGVGALAAAAVQCLRAGREPGEPPALVGIEPGDAACVAAAVDAGHVVEVPGPHRSIMAGLNCGQASMLALPTVAAGFQAFVAVDDDRARQALRAMAEAGLDVGETGAAALAGLTALVEDHNAELPIAPDATVLLLATEGVTDPVGFSEIVGRPPRSPR